MREIKCRAKRIDNGEWVYGSPLIDYVTGKFFIHALGNSVNDSDKVGEEGILNFVAFEVIRETVSQYTGLKYKNGKEIYEGDILKSDSGYRLIVKFGNHGYSAYTDCVELGFYCECVSEQAKRQQIREDFLFWVREEESEIIGNIHENPELLENS